MLLEVKMLHSLSFSCCVGQSSNCVVLTFVGIDEEPQQPLKPTTSDSSGAVNAEEGEFVFDVYCVRPALSEDPAEEGAAGDRGLLYLLWLE